MTRKRIVIASNYDDETFDESFLDVPSMPTLTAVTICGHLNNIEPDGYRYYKVVDMDYQLHKFQP